MIPIELFKSSTVWITYFNALAGGMLLFSCLYFLSTYFVIVVGYGPTKSGVQLLYLAPAMGAGTYVGIVMIKFLRQPMYPIFLGSALQPIGAGLLSYATSHGNNAMVNGTLAIVGFSLGITLGPLSLQVQYSHPQRYTPILVTLNLFFRTLGGTVGLAQLSAVLESGIRSSIRKALSDGQITLLESVQILKSLESLGSSGVQGVNGTGISGLAPRLREVVLDAYREGTSSAFVSLVPWCGVAAVMCIGLKKIVEDEPPLPRPNASRELGDQIELRSRRSLRMEEDIMIHN